MSSQTNKNMNRINSLFKLRFLSVCLYFHQLDQ